MYKIMLVEDDVTITEVLERQLKKWGYLVNSVTDFGSVLSQFEHFQPHLVLLDISLPFYDGYHWCAEIRKTSQAPIIFISSASDDMNMVMAINLGADDFVTKPFNMEVIIAKIHALLRRTYSFGADMSTLKLGEVTLNLGDCTLHYGAHKIDLTKNEFKILQVLMEHKGNIVTRSNLMKRLWETESFIDDNTLTVNVTRLRKKLDKIGLGQYIATKKGVGYSIEA